jgi:hypothetical protein
MKKRAKKAMFCVVSVVVWANCAMELEKSADKRNDAAVKNQNGVSRLLRR